MKHSRQICKQDTDDMKKKKNIHTQQSSSGQVPTYCIDVAITIMQKNFCLTYHCNYEYYENVAFGYFIS